MARLLAYKRPTRKTGACQRKAERGRRLRSKHCVCPCEPPHLIVILEPRLSISLWTCSPQPLPFSLPPYRADPTTRALSSCARAQRTVTVPRIMSFSLREALIAIVFGLLLF